MHHFFRTGPELDCISKQGVRVGGGGRGRGGGDTWCITSSTLTVCRRRRRHQPSHAQKRRSRGGGGRKDRLVDRGQKLDRLTRLDMDRADLDHP